MAVIQEERFQISILTIYTAILVVSITANILVVLVLWRKFRRHGRTTTDKSFIVVIISQALSHLVFVIVSIPVALVHQSSPEWSVGPLWCKIVRPLQAAALLLMVYSYVLRAFYQWNGIR